MTDQKWVGYRWMTKKWGGGRNAWPNGLNLKKRELLLEENLQSIVMLTQEL